MKKRSILSLLLTSLLVASSLAGCGSKSSQGSTSGGKGDITAWVNTSDETPEGTAWAKIADNFNKKYDGKYKVKIEYIPRSGSGGGYEDKVNAALTTNSLPDVLTLDGPNTAAYAKSGIIAPLDEYLTDKQDMKDILPSIIDQGTYNGKMYAIGFSESNVGIYYNKKMFKDAGIDSASLPTLDKPWDWNQFMSICDTLVKKYNVPAIDMSLSDKSEMLMYAFTPFVWSQGGDVVSKDGTKADGILNDANGVKAFNFIQEMVKKGYTTQSPAKQAFEQGKYPMKFSGSWTIEDLNKNFKNIDYGILPYPVSPDTHKLVSPSGSWQVAVSNTTDKKVAAAEFAKFSTNTESNEIMSLGNSVLPMRYSTIKNVQGKVSENMKFLMDQNAKSAHARPVIVSYPQVSRAFQDAVTDVTYYKNNPDVKKVLDTRAKEMQAAIDKQK
ncbi:MAG: ABC-type sugar transport system, periplasmic component [Clostridiaceae bacterium]|jgi:fructooligosaccharide transport system substrate-binding protein|nr:ABC-type sugar transport system, periplasmic component [Clostridiaceae bacterium]